MAKRLLTNPFTGEVLVDNVFCPTGQGGGIDPTCSPKGKGVSVKRPQQKGEVAKWLQDWSWGKEGDKSLDFDASSVKPSDEVIKATSQYRPAGRVIVFRSHRVGAKHEGFESWTTQRGMADFITETSEDLSGTKRVTLRRVVDPSEILISTNHSPSYIKQAGIDDEVVVAHGKMAKRMAKLRGERLARGQQTNGDRVN